MLRVPKTNQPNIPYRLQATITIYSIVNDLNAEV